MSRSLQDVQRHEEHDDIIGSLPEGFHTEPETTGDAEWRKLNVLSLDGGGIRGYWSLLTLEILMQYIAEAEEEADERTYHSFAPQPWPENVSHIRLTEDQEEGRRQAHNEEARTRILPRTQRYLPCHYFDYICGSSTGALIAIMLGRFRMTVPDCQDEYKNLGQKVFGKPRMFFTLRYGVGERFKYKAARLENVCQDVARRRNEQPEQAHGRITFPSGRGLCKTLVTTRKREAKGRSDSLYLIRSYDHDKRATPDPSTRPTPRSTMRTSEHSYRPTPRSTMRSGRANTGMSDLSTREVRKKSGTVDVNYEKAQDLEIWQVARAATAAPLYFEPFKVESALTKGYTLFTDGGFGHTNNPVRDAKREIEKLHGDTSIGIVVSVGTARKAQEARSRAFWSTVPGLTREFAAMATDPERNHHDMQQEHEHFANDGRNFSYYRLNDPGGLQTELDEWKPKNRLFSKKIGGSKTIEVITNKFNMWAKEPINIRELQHCAAGLVDRRRKRMDTPRWERYATGARYECREPDCFLELDRDQLREHLRQAHNILGKERLDEKELRCRKYWRYQAASAANGS